MIFFLPKAVNFLFKDTVPIDRILSVKNERAWVSMDFTYDNYSALRTIEKMKILGSVLVISKRGVIFRIINGFWPSEKAVPSIAGPTLPLPTSRPTYQSVVNRCCASALGACELKIEHRTGPRLATATKSVHQ